MKLLKLYYAAGLQQIIINQISGFGKIMWHFIFIQTWTDFQTFVFTYTLEASIISVA